MKVLLVGVGGVGEAIAAIARHQSWVEQIVLSDYSLERAKEVQTKLDDPQRFPVEWIDASQQSLIEDIARKYNVDLIMNACDHPSTSDIRSGLSLWLHLYGFSHDSLRAAFGETLRIVRRQIGRLPV